ncbi:MAG: hypothetical protein R2800_14675 [Flavipsychrobacter sp.]
MKKLIAAILLSGLLFGANEVSAHGKHTKQRARTINQKARIHNGVCTGQLTAYEARQLRGQQRTIKAMKMVARADGRVTQRERMVINRAQRNASRNIYRMKNNRRVR